jgi:hypothetical protein
MDGWKYISDKWVVSTPDEFLKLWLVDGWIDGCVLLQQLVS